MSASSQLIFNFQSGKYEHRDTFAANEDIAEEAPEQGKKKKEAPGKRSAESQRRQLRRAALRWLGENDPPAGMATQVATRLSRYRADVAAFWNRAVRNHKNQGPSRLLVPQKTALFQCFTARRECWPHCTEAEKLLPVLRELSEQLEQIKGRIRIEEPELQDDGALFEEFAEWDYKKSANPEYHRLHEQLKSYEKAVYEGTKFEQMRQAELADELYLVVPQNMVDPDELAEGWGLLWVTEDLGVELVKTPDHHECMHDNRMHLIQNIAAANSQHTLFVNGLRQRRNGEISYVKKPRGHRKTQTPQLG